MMKIKQLFIAGLVLMMIICAQIQASAQSARSFKVEVTGKGQPMIFIPGLGCSGDVWRETVAHYKDKYQCHVLTLAGFAGVPAVERASIFSSLDKDLSDYIREQHLEKPIIIGHSIGGMLALNLAANHPELAAKLIIVDSVPFMPGLFAPGSTAEMARAQAEMIKNSMLSQTPEQFRQAQEVSVKRLLANEEKQPQVVNWNTASDRKTFVQALSEAYTTDLRKDLAKIKAPTLVIAAWVALKDVLPNAKEIISAVFQDQYSALTGCRITLNDKGRHFVMYDDQEGFFKTIDGFINSEPTNVK